jgi:hypothetical protein
MLFRFHGSLEYGSIGCVSRVGIALPDAEKNSIQNFLSSHVNKKKRTLPSVCGGMHISTILDLHRFVRRLYEAPKFALDVILCHADITKHVRCGVFFACVVLFRGMCLEPPSTELAVACLKTGQRMLLPLVKTKIPPSSEYASRAVPLPTRHSRKRGF